MTGPAEATEATGTLVADYGCLRRWDAGGVARLELHRPDAGNAIDLELADALADAVSAIAGDDAVGCVLLTGAGRRFCVGGDVAAMAAATHRADFLRELAGGAHRAVLALMDLPVPIVAAVHGVAAGAGMSLTLTADLVIAAESATFVPAYAGVGLTPDCGMTWWLPKYLGQRRAQSILLLGEAISATQAADLGLITTVADDAAWQATALAAAGTVARGPHPALGRSARLLRGDRAALAAHLDREQEEIGVAAESAAAEALVARFVARRAAAGRRG